MSDPYSGLAARLSGEGVDVPAVEARLRELVIETPSWGYGDVGHALRRLPASGPSARRARARRRRRRGAPPDRHGGRRGHALPLGRRGRLRRPARARGRARAARRRGQPEPLPGPGLQARLHHPSRPRVRAKAVEHLLDCLEIARALRSDAQSLWLADGTNYPGQDDLRARRRRLLDSLGQVYAELPSGQELLVEYKFFEPAFYATDLADWGSALLVCQALGERAKVLVDLGHHAQGTNVEQIVGLLADGDRLGGFHFNNRKYADDDLIVGSVNPFELFLIFVELASEPLPRLTIDQSHNIEAKVEAMVLSVINLQEAYAKALLVDRAALAAAQAEGDVLGGHKLLLDAYNTDVRPLCARVRAELGAAEDPIAALRGSGYAARMAAERDTDSLATGRT